MNLDHFGMDTITLAGPLEAKLRAVREVPLDIRIAYEALSWGRHVNEYPQAWEIVQAAGRENLGLALDSFHILANRTSLDALEEIEPKKIFIVQLSDFLWQEVRSAEDRIETARHSRVFPGEGVHSEKVIELTRALDEVGYRGDYSCEVLNDAYRQLPLPLVAQRARQSVKWITGRVARRSLPARRQA